MATFKAIGDLVEEYTFLIPYYQRGYRWEEKQVRELLDDLWEFHKKLKKGEKGYYFLQPLVVKRVDNIYRLIDGQQRLTTIYIIIRAIEEICGLEKEKLYTLIYEREERNEILEENLSQCKSDKEIKSIDFCYMCSALNTVRKWIEEKGTTRSNLKLFRDFLLLSSDWDEESKKDINSNIRFLWYELEKDQDEIDTFIRLNIGKIPLTNAELIKSFILQLDTNPQKRFEISKEWDEMEYLLENKEFFGFLTTQTYPTPMELIFEVLMNMHAQKDEYTLYEAFIKKYDNSTTIDEVWSEVRKVFYLLWYWFEDRELYHLIGYLIQTEYTINKIYHLYEQSYSKSYFLGQLKRKIKENFKEKGFDTDHLEIDLMMLDYLQSKDKKILTNILLLFNILTLLHSSKESHIKFSFYRFNQERWSLEHIVPRNEPEKHYKKTLEELLALKLIEPNDKETILQLLKDPHNHEEKLKEFAKKYANRFSDPFFDEENKNRIYNLTLLSTKENASLSNALFPIKRARIIKKDQKGSFIPIATKNLFLKYYSKEANLTTNNLLRWSKEDSIAYIEAIQNTLQTFFKEIE